MPFIGHMFDRVRITSPCHGHVNTWFYLNLVDVADNTENTINIDFQIVLDKTFSKLNVPVVWSIMQFTELVIIWLGCQKAYNNPILWKIE